MDNFVRLTFLLFVAATANTVADNTLYYWRTYDGVNIPIPPDAVNTEVGNVFVAQVTNVSIYPGTLNPLTGTATINYYATKVTIKDDIKILCTSEPKRLRWEWVNIETVQGAFLDKLVEGGPSGGAPTTYIGKVFHENEWKISKVFPYTHSYRGLLIWTNSDGKEYRAYDFQILMFD